jgi:hypothetical protein
VAHHGSFVRERIAGSGELVGSDVVLVHFARTRTSTTRAQRRAVQRYDDVGELAGWLHDLGGALAKEQERAAVFITPAQRALTLSPFDYFTFRSRGRFGESPWTVELTPRSEGTHADQLASRAGRMAARTHRPAVQRSMRALYDAEIAIFTSPMADLASRAAPSAPPCCVDP